MKIIIGGDLVPTKANMEKFKNDDFFQSLDVNFKKVWSEADFRVFNLECPLCEYTNKNEKNGACIQAPEDAINGIKSLNPNLVLLSNNHILDYRVEGLDNTIKLLEEHNIEYTGIIENSQATYEPYFINCGNKRICVYNVCETEFSIATENRKGANPLNEAKNYREIENAKNNCDYLIVAFHAGKEFYRFPSPNLQRICRNFIDFGADFVITQHSHCIGCEEEYNGGKILYGQGNFIFDDGVVDEYWGNALLVEVDVSEKGVIVNYIPIEMANGLIKLSKNDMILRDFYKRSELIKSNEFVKEEYSKFANKNINMYLGIMNKPNVLKRALNKLLKRKFYTKLYDKKKCLQILNVIECEAHRELFTQGLKERIKGFEYED